MDDMVEIIEEKTSTNNSFVEVSSIEVPKERVEAQGESYFDGSLLGLLAFSYFYATISVISFGLLSAWGKCLLNEYIYNHTVISGKRLKFEGNGKDLFPYMFKWDFFKLITFNIYSIWEPTRYKEWEVSKLHFEDEIGNRYQVIGIQVPQPVPYDLIPNWRNHVRQRHFNIQRKEHRTPCCRRC